MNNKINFYGEAGCGKTTLLYCFEKILKHHFVLNNCCTVDSVKQVLSKHVNNTNCIIYDMEFVNNNNNNVIEYLATIENPVLIFSILKINTNGFKCFKISNNFTCGL